MRFWKRPNVAQHPVNLADATESTYGGGEWLYVPVSGGGVLLGRLLEFRLVAHSVQQNVDA